MKSLFLFAFLITLSAGCSADTAVPISDSPDGKILAIITESFFSFRCPEEELPPFTPSMPAYELPIDQNNILNYEFAADLVPSGELPSGLLLNGFAVDKTPWLGDEPVRAFNMLSNDKIPVYVSSGIVLHLFHIYFDQILAQIEQDHLYHELSVLSDHLYIQAIERNDDLSAAYAAVGSVLLDTDFEVDPSVLELVTDELMLIKEHEGFAESPIFGYAEDYSQYVPRGHYDKNETLRRYFLASMWFGRMTFLLNGGEPYGPDAPFLVSREKAIEQTLAAAAIAADMMTDAPGEITLKDVWGRIYLSTALFAGFSDDLSIPEYLPAVKNLADGEEFHYGLLDEEFYIKLKCLIDSLHTPASIYSGTGEIGLLPGDDEAELHRRTAGFRLLGQRYSPDSDVLGTLVYPATGVNPSGDYRTMPSGLDVAGVFGSSYAENFLKEKGCFEFQDYGNNFESMRNQLNSLQNEVWQSNLYMMWLRTLRYALEEKGEGYPVFMTVPEWGIRQLTRFLASWAILRHDTILYVKQSYTAQLVCIPPSQLQPSAGFVEPVPEVYNGIITMLAMLKVNLTDLDMLDPSMSINIENTIEFTRSLRDISIKELEGTELSEEESAFLGAFSARLLELTSGIADIETGSETTLIADVHTDQNSGNVLEVASGNLDLIMVVFPRPDGHLEIAAGPVLSYYEFPVPQQNRMTDSEWRALLHTHAPDRPWWNLE